MVCQRCGYSSGSVFTLSCPLCGGILANSTPSPKITIDIPWEDPTMRAYPVNALIQTLQKFFFNTDTFFRNLKCIQSSKNALLFALISGSFGIVSTLAWSYIFPENSWAVENTDDQIYSYIFSPFFILLQILACSVYVHFMLFISRSSKESFDSTFRITSYSEGAMILNAIPFFGTILSSLAWLYFIITGIHHVHGISKLRAFFVLFLPILIVVSLGVLLLFFVIIFALTTGADSGAFLQKLLER